MTKLELVISCVAPPRAPQTPQIRAWVDPQPERGLDAEFELLLQPLSERVRRAEIELAETHDYLFYRVGIVADPSTVWHLVIQEASSGGVLHEDSDLLALPKGYLVGSCQLRDRAKRTLPEGRSQPVSRTGGPRILQARLLRAARAAALMGATP